jgi:hypothetical protein
VQLIVAGFGPEDAFTLTHDYFNALLDAGLLTQAAQTPPGDD